MDSTPPKNEAHFETSIPPGSNETKPPLVDTNRESLERILAAPNITKEQADHIRAQLAAIDSGSVPLVAPEISAEAKPESQANQLARGDYLAAILNGTIDPKDANAGQIGAGFDTTAMLIAEAKRRGQENKN